MTGTSRPETVTTKQRRIAKMAREAPGMVWTTLAHHIDVDWLREAYERTRKDGAVGVDGQTAQAYAEKLEENLQALLDRFKSGTYRAPPVRRVNIPKDGGRKTRPIGIPTFEDKVLQRAVCMVLEPVYEQDFLDCSYGFRPGRSPHQALEKVWQELMNLGGGWVLDLDIQSYFDTLEPKHLRSFLDQRVRDGVLRRMIDKWLKAGVLEGEERRYPERGTPQGGVISPLLANIYLHEVLDVWFEQQVKPRLMGPAYLARFADDVVIILANKGDASRVLEVLPSRFGRYGLSLHPEKTRMVPFRRPPKEGPSGGGSRGEQPGTFDWLGFTHYWGRSWRKHWVVKRRTASGRLSRAVKRIWHWCRRARHWPLRTQHKELSRKMRGHYSYYGITGNGRALGAYQHWVIRAWHYWLSRRSQRGWLTWERFNALLRVCPLPPARVVHSIFGQQLPLPSVAKP